MQQVRPIKKTDVIEPMREQRGNEVKRNYELRNGKKKQEDERRRDTK